MQDVGSKRYAIGAVRIRERGKDFAKHVWYESGDQV